MSNKPYLIISGAIFLPVGIFHYRLPFARNQYLPDWIARMTRSPSSRVAKPDRPLKRKAS